MQIIRALLWALLLFGILIFSAFNWRPVEVTIWQNLVLETKIPALVIISFLLGLVPMWLFHLGTKWRYEKRLRMARSPSGASEPASNAAIRSSTDPATSYAGADRRAPS